MQSITKPADLVARRCVINIMIGDDDRAYRDYFDLMLITIILDKMEFQHLSNAGIGRPSPPRLIVGPAICNTISPLWRRRMYHDEDADITFIDVKMGVCENMRMVAYRRSLSVLA